MIQQQIWFNFLINKKTIDLVDVTSAFAVYKLLEQNMNADFGDVTIAFDD